jgi:hypothetical protein
MIIRFWTVAAGAPCVSSPYSTPTGRQKLSIRNASERAYLVGSATALMPFGSVSELLSLRRKVRNFVKARYPARLGSRQIRCPVGAAAMWLHFGVVWLILFQMLPEHRWKVSAP